MVDEILAAERRIRPHVRETILDRSDALSAWIKCENLQLTGSFKLRGALNKILLLPPDALQRGVVTASTGNHARGVAHALSLVGAQGTIYLPTTAPRGKIEALARYPSVTVELHGTDSGVTEAFARDIAAQSGRTYISPYNDRDVIAGQGTIGLELERQCPGVDTVFVSVGGGGLISGIAGYLKARRPIRVVGCWPANSPALAAALEAGRIVEIPERPTLSDGTRGGVEAGSITLDLARDLIDDRVLVSESEIAAAIRLVLAEHRMAIEGAAAVAVAASLKTAPRHGEAHRVIVLSGGNISYETLQTVISSASFPASD